MDHDHGVTGYCVRPRGNGGGGGTKYGRWNPTVEQVKVLTDLFRSGLRTPSTEQIQKISSELSGYGKIESKNVFYWFQNHKARERQKRRRVSVADNILYNHHEVLCQEKIAFARNHIDENQLSEPQKVLETLQLFPLNSLNDSEPEKFRIYSDEWKENTNSFSYCISGDKLDHLPLDLRLSFL